MAPLVRWLLFLPPAVTWSVNLLTAVPSVFTAASADGARRMKLRRSLTSSSSQHQWRLMAPEESQSVRHRRASTAVAAPSNAGEKKRMWRRRSSLRSERQVPPAIAVVELASGGAREMGLR
nr:unnamed protein product [Digitaria exilis]